MEASHWRSLSFPGGHPCEGQGQRLDLRLAPAAGAPSLTNEKGSIGATDLLLSSAGEVITAQLSMPIDALAHQVILIAPSG